MQPIQTRAHLRQGQTRFWPFTRFDGTAGIASGFLLAGTARTGFIVRVQYYPHDEAQNAIVSEAELVYMTCSSHRAARRAIALGRYRPKPMGEHL